MKKEIYMAAATGNTEFLKEALATDVEAAVAVYRQDDLLGLTSHGNNIIHVAVEHGQQEFIKEAFQSIIPALLASDLICAKNKDGNTPLHLAAKQQIATIAQYLISFCKSSEWRIQNNKGNTPLHVALMSGGKCIQVAAYLLRVGPEVASYVNHRKQTPLHLAVEYDNQGARISMTNMMKTLNGLGASLDYERSLIEEDSLSLIKMLLDNITTTVCCLQDEDGMTPLVRATLNSYHLAVETIINYCPESIEIPDQRGKTILHHIKFPTFLQARDFLRSPGISVLMDCQDEDGNSPLHVAISNCDYNMVIAMIECNANFTIKNKEGTSPAILIQSNSNSFLQNAKGDIRQFNSIKDEVMPKEFFEAAYNGNWQWLLQKLKEAAYEKQFLSRLPDGTNIVHVAVQHCKVDYNAKFEGYSNDDDNYSSDWEELIVEALKKYPILNCQTDYKGYTPLHYAMFHNILKPGGRAFKTMMDLLQHQRSSFSLLPWETKDLKGDTLLHVAIKFKRYEFAKLLIELDAKLVGETNNFKETPLHYLCRYSAIRGRTMEDMVDLLVEKDVMVVHSFDADGLTPLLRAVDSSSIQVATRILHHCPQSVKQVDPQFHRNVLHYLELRFFNIIHREFIQLPQLQYLLTSIDSQGNTPLHLAIKQRRYDTARILIEHYLALKVYSWYKIRNNIGNTVIDELSKIQDVPRRFQAFLRQKLFVLPLELQRAGRSLYGVHYSNMKDFMNAIAVMAALLATITFAAAFTVPGGYDQGKGTSLLGDKIAFQAFMFADVVGMCSSMMAVFCVTWFFTADRIEDEGKRICDLSMGLLHLSLYATLVSFMTGVYVTTIPQVPWLAIFTCVICSLVVIMMRELCIKEVLAHQFVQMYYAGRKFTAWVFKWTKLNRIFVA